MLRMHKVHKRTTGRGPLQTFGTTHRCKFSSDRSDSRRLRLIGIPRGLQSARLINKNPSPPEASPPRAAGPPL